MIALCVFVCVCPRPAAVESTGDKRRRRGEGEEGPRRGRRGKGGDGDTKRSVLSRLEALLKEAGDFPVQVEEAKLLTQEVVARRWMARARRVLGAKPRMDTMEVNRRGRCLDRRACTSVALLPFVCPVCGCGNALRGVLRLMRRGFVGCRGSTRPGRARVGALL